MTRGLGVLAIALAAALLTGCQGKAADDAAFGKRVHAYLLAHPEVLQESARRLDAKLAEDELATERQGAERLPRLRAAVERDPADFVRCQTDKSFLLLFFKKEALPFLQPPPGTATQGG